MDTICAIATAQGGAIALIRVSGEESINIVDNIFYGKCKLNDTPSQLTRIGEIRAKDNKVVDDVLVTVFREPKSYTGENTVEISCHASPYILQTIITLLVNNGCRLAKPGEYTQRAFLNGKMDLSQAEAVADLIASRNAIAHKLAMNQMKGGYSRRLNELRDKLIKLISLLELELDFAEEDVEFADREQLTNLTQETLKEIQSLKNTFHAGQALKEGVQVAIIGAPNVGKSTLLNALIKDNKAIVSDVPGTTRDIVEDTTMLQNMTFHITDTAGIRETDDKIEKLGIEKTKKAISQAHIIIMMNEPGIPFPNISIREDQHVIRLTNKTTSFQALNGIGIKELEEQLVNTYKTQYNKSNNCKKNNVISTSQDSENNIIVTNMRHYEAFVAAEQDMQQALDTIKKAFPVDLVVQNLKYATKQLSSILGEITPQNVLENIFSHFCIGK